MAITLMRSRFQPFTKGHYEAIRSYYLACRDKPNLPKKLALCVIRDSDSVRMAHPQHKDTFITGAESREEQGLLFRHLDFFNPFSGYEVIERIQHSLHCFAKEDALSFSEGDKYTEFLDEISIILCPLKFGELVDALKHGGVSIPKHLERHVNKIRDQVAETLKKNGAPSDLAEQVNKAFSESKKELLNNVLSTWGRLAKDLLPDVARNQVHWLMPIFDNEDLEDCSELKSHDFTVYYLLTNNRKYTEQSVHELFGGTTLGMYGLFIQSILLGFLENGVISTISKSDDWEKIRIERNKALCEFLCPCTSREFSKKTELKFAQAKRVLNTLGVGVFDQHIAKQTQWDERSIRELRDSNSDPYLVIIALLNMLAKDKFESVRHQILFPEQTEQVIANQLGVQFNLEFKELEGPIVELLKRALENQPDTLTLTEKHELEKVTALLKTISEKKLETKVHSNNTLLLYFKHLAEAVTNRRLEDIDDLVNQIENNLGFPKRRWWG